MEINGIRYQFSKLNARKQFHVVRRLTPVMNDLQPVLVAWRAYSDKETDEEKEIAGLVMFEHLAVALGKLKDEDADFIMDNLLDTVSRDAGNGIGFTPIRVNGIKMFQDIDMLGEIKLTYGAFKANFSDFIPAIRSIFGQQQETIKT